MTTKPEKFERWVEGTLDNFSSQQRSSQPCFVGFRDAADHIRACYAEIDRLTKERDDTLEMANKTIAAMRDPTHD